MITMGEDVGTDVVLLILVGVNLVLGFAGAIPVARALGKLNGNTTKVRRLFAVLIGVYFIEAVALTMGMGIPVLNVCLAFVWGLVFGVWVRGRASPREVLRASTYLSLYSSLPAISFLVIPLLVWAGGGAVFSSEAGRRFGIPDFLPWPVTTIAGFYGACAVGAAVLKGLITTGEVGLLVHLWNRRRTERGSLVGHRD